MRTDHFEQTSKPVGINTNAEAAHHIAGTVFDAFADHWPAYFRIGNHVRRSALIHRIYKHTVLRDEGYEKLVDDKARADYINHAGRSIYKDISGSFEPGGAGVHPGDTSPFSDFCNVFYELDHLATHIARDGMSQRKEEIFNTRCLNDGIKDPMALFAEIYAILNMDCLALCDRPLEATVIRMNECVVQMQHRIIILRDLDNYVVRRRNESTDEDFNRGYQTHEHAPDPQQRQIDLLRTAIRSLLQGMEGRNYRSHVDRVEECLDNADRISRSVNRVNAKQPFNNDPRDFGLGKPIY